MRNMRLGLLGVLALGIAGMPMTGMAADGTALFEKNCAGCHGVDGKGDTKAGKLIKVRDFTAADVKAELTSDHVHQVIEQGITDKATGKTRMKAFKDKFSADEIDALAKHVLDLAGASK